MKIRLIFQFVLIFVNMLVVRQFQWSCFNTYLFPLTFYKMFGPSQQNEKFNKTKTSKTKVWDYSYCLMVARIINQCLTFSYDQNSKCLNNSKMFIFPYFSYVHIFIFLFVDIACMQCDACPVIRWCMPADACPWCMPGDACLVMMPTARCTPSDDAPVMMNLWLSHADDL